MVSFVLQVLLLAQDPTPEDLVKKLTDGTEDEQKEAADALVKLGKKGREALAKAHKSSTKPEIRKRYERAALRIDAGTDAIEGKVGEVSVVVEEPTLALELDKAQKKVLHVKSPLRFEGAKDVTVTLAKARLVTFKESVELAVLGPGKKNFSWDLEGGRPRLTQYGNYITPRWPEGTSAVIVYEFTVGKETVTLRTPVVDISK